MQGYAESAIDQHMPRLQQEFFKQNEAVDDSIAPFRELTSGAVDTLLRISMRRSERWRKMRYDMKKSPEEIESSFKLNLIKMIAPLTPHIAEELWEINGGGESVFMEAFPEFDAALAEEDTISIAVQVNGKLRGNIEVVKTISNEELLISARAQENVGIHLKDKNVIKEIVVPQRLVNFVVK